MTDIYKHGHLYPRRYPLQTGNKEEHDIYLKEKSLLEHDAHLLEEQRYLNRLKNSQLKQNKNVNYHYEQITKPLV